jgi:hypothetical protein
MSVTGSDFPLICDEVLRDFIRGYGNGLVRVGVGQNSLAFDEIARAFSGEYYEGISTVRLFPYQID